MQFYGQFSPKVDEFIFNRYFSDVGIQGVFVECGAYDGLTDSSCKFFEETMGWTGFNFEPVPPVFGALEKNRPKSRNIQAALSEKSGKVTFRHAIHPKLGEWFGNGSIDHSTAHLDLLNEMGCTFQEYEVVTLSWPDFIEQEGIRKVDIFVLDVEGHELSVLAGMKGAKVLPAIFCIEFGHIGFGQLREVVENLGYTYDIHSHANAYFVRNDALPLINLRRAARAAREGAPKNVEAAAEGSPAEKRVIARLRRELHARQVEVERLKEELKNKG